MQQTTYPLKIHAIIRSQGQQPRLYVSFPLALAAANGLNPGDQDENHFPGLPPARALRNLGDILKQKKQTL